MDRNRIRRYLRSLGARLRGTPTPDQADRSLAETNERIEERRRQRERRRGEISHSRMASLEELAEQRAKGRMR